MELPQIVCQERYAKFVKTCFLKWHILLYIWDEIFKNKPTKICGRQPLKSLKGYDWQRRPCPFKFFKGRHPQILLGPFLNTLSHLRGLYKLKLYPTTPFYSKFFFGFENPWPLDFGRTVYLRLTKITL